MKFKQVLAGLLVGAMVVTSAPVSGLGALSALAADEGGSTETKSYTYTKLTEGLTASADCGNGNETPDPMVIVDGNEDNYWHSAWSGDNQPVRQGGEVYMSSNNNITLTLSEASEVKKLEYVSNGKNANGTITKCNIYYKTSDENAVFQKVQEDPYTLNFTDDKKATIEFAAALSDVKEIKIEVRNTAGGPSNTFISGRELYIYRDDSTKVESGITAKAECSSQKEAGLKNLVDNNEDTGYHSSWANGGTVEEGEGFGTVTRPGTTTTPTELVSRNNLYINLPASKTVGKLTYLPRQGLGDGYANGRITEANIYVSNSDKDVSAITDEDWKKVQTVKWADSTDKKEVTFSPEMAKHIRIEVKHSAGNKADAYISAAEIEVYEAKEEEGTQPGTEEYAKLTGLTGVADSEELKTGNAPAAKAVDGKTDTFWHTNWSDATKPKPESSGGKLTGNNTYTITLEKPSTVAGFTYIPRNLYSGAVIASGAITEGKVLIQTKDSTDWIEAGIISGWTYPNKDAEGAEENFKEKKVTFTQAYSGVTKVKVVVTQTAGSEVNKHINAAEFGVIGKEDEGTPAVTEDKVIKAPVLTAVAPVKGANPADVTAESAEGYTVETAWTNSEGGEVTTFEAGKEYTLTATLTATKGYKFTETSKPNTIKVGEENVKVTAVIGGDGKTMTLTHKFTVPADAVQYAKLTGLTGVADSEELTGEKNGNGPAAKAVDGKTDTFWHTNWSDATKPKPESSGGKLTGNNTYTITLEKPSTVAGFTYIPRNLYSGAVIASGAITEGKVLIQTKDSTDWIEAGIISGWTYPNKDAEGAEENFKEKKVTFTQAYSGVTKVKVVVTQTAGSEVNKHINAAEFGVIGKEDEGTPAVTEDKVIKAPVLTAVAPVKGANPADVTAESAEGYTVETAWTNSEGGEVTTFEAGKEYTLTATLTATKGYKFTETSKPNTIKVGEENVKVTAVIGGDGKTMTLTHKFTVPADAVQYAKLTGLTGAADSQELTGEPNGNGPIAKALDGDLNTYWHTNWKDNSAPKATTDGTKLTGNNNYIITLAKPSTVTSVTYVPRNGYDSSSGKVNNGAIEQCKVYVTTDGTTWKLAGTIGENNAWSYVNQGVAGADQNFVEKTVTFDKAYADVTKVKIEAIKTAGPQPNQFINAAEFGVIGKGDGTPGEVTCDCALGEITGVQDQTVELDVADSKTVKLQPKATATPCRVDGHDGKVVYTYAVKDPGKTGATVTTDGTVTVKDAGTAVITVTATLSRKGKEALVKKKDVTLTVKSNKASAAEKKELQDEVASVAGQIADKDNYTEESYQKLKDAVDAANRLINSGTASKKQIADAKAAIAAAKSGLITKTAAAKKKLGDLLEEVAKLDKTLYTAESYNAMVAADEAAVKAYNKADATEEELTKAYNALKAAQDKLVFKLDQAKKEAAKALEAAKAIYDAGQKDYDDASWKAFGDAYNALKNAGEKADAAALTTLIGALTKAQGALTVKKAETPKPEVKLAAPAVKEVKAKAAKGGVTVTVTVEPVKDAAAYDVYRVVKGKAAKVGTTAAGKTAVTDTTAIRGASYYAVAVSADGKTVSEAGAAVAVKLAKAPKIKKASAGTKSVKLTWKKAKGTKVVVYRSTKKNSGYKKAATSRKGAASLVNKKVKAGKTYYYKIATVKGKTVSAMSKAKRVKIKK